MERRSHAQLTVYALAGVLAALGGCSQSTTSGPNVGVQSILFIQRQVVVTQTNADGTTTQTYDVDSGNTQVLDYTRYVPGGSLNLLSPARPDGTVTNLTSAFTQADFNGADVSFDGTQAVFSMRPSQNDTYHIYTVQLSPGSDGKFEMHQLTNGAWNDVTPVYVPNGLVAFVTDEMYTAMGTRADEYEHQRQSLQLATISVSGGDAQRRLFAQNLSHTVAPFLRYDGKIAFSQWEHFGPINDVKLRAVNPDGTQEVAVAGQHDNGGSETKPSDALFNMRELSPNVMIGIGTARDRTIHAGALLQVDARNQTDPVCLDPNSYSSGATVGHACLDEQHASYTVLTPQVPLTADPSATSVGRYREPSILPDGRVLVSWADGAVNDQNELSLTPPDFGIYLYDPTTGTNELVYNQRVTWELNALAVTARTEPPVIPPAQIAQDSTIPAHLGSVNISQTSLDETVTGAEFNNVPLGQALQQGAVAVRVIEGFSSEISPGMSIFGLTMFEGAAVLGEAPIYGDGSWLAAVPPYIPIHLQPIDKYGLAIRNQQLWIKGMPGETRRCIGCHESRTDPGTLALGQNQTAADLAGPQPFTEPIADRTEFPWNKKVQPVLDAKCVTCHNSSTTSYYYMTRTDPVTGQQTTYAIPTLDLSSNPVTVYYDESVATWPASYVSIFYPAAMQMDPDTTGSVQISGTVPPMYGIPGSARASVLTQKVNLRAADGTTAWSTPLHPEGDQPDAGVQLTDDERKTIAVYPMDLGGQYYSRQNVNFAPIVTGDPVNPSGAAP